MFPGKVNSVLKIDAIPGLARLCFIKPDSCIAGNGKNVGKSVRGSASEAGASWVFLALARKGTREGSFDPLRQPP